MKRYIKLILSVTILSLLLTGCSINNKGPDFESQLKEKDDKILSLEEEIRELKDKLDELEDDFDEVELSDGLLSTAMEVLELLKDKDMEDLSDFVHPSKGLRFTPYDFIDINNDLTFSAVDVSNLGNNGQIYNWGDYDGSGESIVLNFSDYYDKFIFDLDFTNPQMIGNNVSIGKGNMINNIKEAYPEGYFFELHFQEVDPQYEGVDWRSLKLVFEELNGDWYLVGIVHGQWTI